MMTLYDKLFKSANFENVSAQQYLPSLVGEILSNFPAAHELSLLQECDDLVLGSRSLQPLGLLVNELLTNAMKYAFVDQNNPEIRVSLKVHGNQVVLVVQDNGRGLPDSPNPDLPSGFGLTLVDALVQQLGGTLQVERHSGTRFTITFIS